MDVSMTAFLRKSIQRMDIVIGIDDAYGRRIHTPRFARWKPHESRWKISRDFEAQRTRSPFTPVEPPFVAELCKTAVTSSL